MLPLFFLGFNFKLNSESGFLSLQTQVEPVTMTETGFEQTIPEWQEWADGIGFTICIPVLFGLAFYHSYMVWNDLYGDRKVLSHRRNIPDKDQMHYKLTYLTLISIYCFALANLLSAISFNWSKDSGCLAIQSILSPVYIVGKTTFYWTLLLRLQQVYGQSNYAYNPKCLGCVAATIAFVLFLATFFVILSFISEDSFQVKDNDKQYPFYCDIGLVEDSDGYNMWSLGQIC